MVDQRWNLIAPIAAMAQAAMQLASGLLRNSNSTVGSIALEVGYRSEAAFARARPILEQMGKTIVHAGGAGNGQAAKICNNMILGAVMIATCEAFALAEKSKLVKSLSRLDMIGFTVYALSFRYGQRHAVELAAAAGLPIVAEAIDFGSPPCSRICCSISMTCWFAPPCSGPHNAQMPAEIDAKRFAPLLPTSAPSERAARSESLMARR